MRTIILFLIFNLISFSLCEECKVTDQNGKIFDLSPLGGNDYQVQDPITSASSLFGIQYVFNLCGEVHSTCSGRSVFEVLEVMGTLTETCEIVGKPDKQRITHTQKEDGTQILDLVWPDGDMCIGSENPLENGQPKKAQFQIICDSIQGSSWEYVHIDGLTVTRCSPMFRIRSPAGCKPGTFSSSSQGFFGRLFTWIFIVGGLYFAIGWIYNTQKFGKSGVDALPHLEFWRALPENLNYGAQKSMEVIKETGDKLKANLGTLNIPSINVPGIKPNQQPYTTV